ncbi:CGNR zinc finger domain-containing protein [Roseococcus sp. YIM B11640]|uniref:CGNR zinc finger domain-containing protein n=1 Tax=Roseococcus sp. YIM B11640 TaxID=3133973 RepID=UPI003C7CA8B0
MVEAAVNAGGRAPRFIAGALCLDFVNTVAWRGDPARREDRIGRYSDLVHWARSADVVSAADAGKLMAQAEQAPRLAARALRCAAGLREELYGLTIDAAGPLSSPGQLSNLLSRLSGIAVLNVSGDRPLWQPAGEVPDLRLPLVPVAVSAASLLVQNAKERVRGCADPQCGWVFLDETRGRTRLWCSMDDCGNRAKARLHYRRKVHGSG